MSSTNVMIVGVGGQGTLLASRVLGHALVAQGYDVKVSEVHGMSQRGGSVVTYVKYGDRVDSPVVELGEADVILAFERLEAARALPYLRQNGTLLVNDREIDPMPVITGAAQYPAGILEKIRAAGANVLAIDAMALAVEAGSPKAVNVVLLGLLSKHLPFDEAVWQQAMNEVVPPKFLELNRRAFALGRAAAE